MNRKGSLPALLAHRRRRRWEGKIVDTVRGEEGQMGEGEFLGEEGELGEGGV